MTEEQVKEPVKTMLVTINKSVLVKELANHLLSLSNRDIAAIYNSFQPQYLAMLTLDGDIQIEKEITKKAKIVTAPKIVLA